MTVHGDKDQDGEERGVGRESLDSSNEPRPSALETGASSGLDPELAAARAEAAEYKDHLQRTVAEMHNLRKRLAKDVDAGKRFAQRDLVRALIPSIDNLERAMGVSPGSSMDPNILAEGVRLVHQEILKSLEKFHIEVIAPTADDGFDPNLHEAVMRQPRADVEANTILSVFEKGYRLEDLVIRPARVMVSAPVEDAGSDEQPGEE